MRMKFMMLKEDNIINACIFFNIPVSHAVKEEWEYTYTHMLAGPLNTIKWL